MSALLLLAVPILGFGVQLSVPRRGVAYAVAGTAIVAELLLALLVSVDGEVMGVTLLVDGVARLLMLALTISVAAAMAAALRGGDVAVVALPLLLLAPTAGAVITRSNPAISSLLLALALLAALVPLNREQRTDQVSVHRYLTATVVGALALLVALTVADLYSSGHDPVLKRLTLALATVGWGLLLAAFPFQFWLLPMCRTATACGATILLAVIRPLGLAVMLGTFATLPWLLSDTRALGSLVIGGTVAAFVTAGFSLSQRNLLARLAYLATADVAFILVGSATGSTIGFSGAVLATISHALAMVIFPASLALIQGGEGVRLWGNVLADARRVGGAGLAVGTFALVGTPLSSSFPGRWLIVQATWAVNPTAVAVLLLTSALVLVSAIGLARTALGGGTDAVPSANNLLGMRGLAVSVAVSGLLVLGIGIYPAPVIETVVSTIADLGGMPAW